MPRVTRRSVAAQEESTSEENSRSTSRGRRSGAKKEEPKTEDVAIGEPQDITPKRGGRQAKAKEPETKTPPKRGRGRSSARGRSQKGDVAENEEEGDAEEEEEKKEEEKVEEEKEEEKPQGRGARSKGRGRGASTAKSEASTSRSTSRSTRGRATKEEEGEEEKIEEEVASETPEAEKGRGSRSRGRSKAETTPSPRTGRSSRRGRSAAEEKEEVEKSQEAENKEETSVKEAEKEVKTPSKEVSGKTKSSPKAGETKKGSPVKAKEREQEAPPEEVKDSPVKGKEEEQETPPTEIKQSKESPPEEEEENKDQEAKVEEEEAMDTGDLGVSVPPSEQKKESPQQSKNATPSKKRKLEEEEEEIAAKKAKTGETATSSESELSGFVVINKNDVPAADSKEVLECVPKSSEPTKPESSSASEMETEPCDSALIVPPAAVGEPVIVPLTEAELAKQYTKVHIDRDEASSTLVEVGSEGTADITAMSVRSLDVSDAVSMDSTSTVDDTSGQVVPPPFTGVQLPTDKVGGSSSKSNDEVTSSVTTSAPPAAPPVNQSPVPQKEADNVPSQQNSTPAVAEPPPVHQNSVEHESQQVNNIEVPVQSQPPAPPAVMEVASTPAQPRPVAASTPVAATGQHTPQINRNGTDELPSQNGSTQNTSPVKQTPSADIANYVPSSTSIDCRKFLLNPAFPLELMDPAFCFSVVSYNILAECHWKRGNYSYTQPQYLELGYRHALMLKELDYLDGDIVCMQEVEPKYYKDTLLPAMTERGYSGWFVKRTKDYFDEGEATFVKNSRFSVKLSEGVSLKDLAYKEVDESGLSSEVSSAVKQYLDRADVLLLTQLECLKTGKTLTIANIHVVFAPPAPDVQCIQVACAIKQLVSKAGSDMNPHIICGDFNSNPTSAGYQLAKDGYLSDDHIRSLQAVEALTNSDSSSRSLIHHMWRAFQHTSSNLKSAYEVAMGKEPPVTTFTSNQHKCLDYVFFSSASLDPVGVLETLDTVVVDKTGGLPSAGIPSDHLSLKAVFRIK
ncbi:glucose-repressible alcohol dehydrogenase transcriptional effector [Plakobranchus ocellatus]|uniref:Glucose-repressible alcohol dehydrogenase transcriptional effector n=1 Tax=Plakobranchus ocellatus TaxID=259542 RepID=A0AAV3YU35_9GAST|nr:glucose-repressible alcohol dehydrogenase transcriptional effector [Plakobranchus ocellatus]